MIEKRVSLKLALMSFVAAVLVVCIHAPSTSTYGLTQLFENFVGRYLAAAAVPFFFVVSGFLLGRHTDELGWYKDALLKRVKTLLIPYLIWCVILCVTRNLNSFVANVIHHQPLMRYIDFRPVYMFGLNPNVNPPQPLWFLRALIFFVAISPVFVFVARKKMVFTLSAIGLFGIGCFHGRIMAIFPGDLFLFTLAPLNVLCFLAGIFLGRNPHLIETSCARGRGIVMAIAIALNLLIAICKYISFALDPMAYSFLRQVAILLTIIGSWQICPAVELPSVFRAQSFPVYLLHGVFSVEILVLKNVMPAFVESAAGYVFSVVFMVACSIAASHLLRRYMPRLSEVIFGGR